MRSAFHAGLAYWERRDAIAAASTQLRRLAAAVDGARDLAPFQWGQLFAATLDFAPTLIVELGRHRGNSTCVFTTAAQALGARVVSLCLSPRWRTETCPRLAGLVPPSWFSHLDAREEDIAAADFEAIVGDAARVLILWDAHGYHVARHVLGRLLPAVAGRPHVVLAHDISDARYETVSAAGERYDLWRGTDWSGPRVRLGHLESGVEQAVSLVDFASRNGVTLHTAAEDIHAAIGTHRARVDAMASALGDLWSPEAHWVHFSLHGRSGPFRFPAAVRTPAIAATPTRSVARPSSAATRPPPVRVERARHTHTIELVITGRADDHGGPEFVDRLVAAAEHNHALLDRAGLRHTFTLVEWNPVPGRRLLAETVAERLPFWDRAYVVDPAWHAALSTNPRLQFMEFFAKNAAVRRSTADAILTTNSDVFLSDAVVARLAQAPPADERVYRAVRHDVDQQVDWRTGGEGVLGDPRHHVRVHQLTAPEFSNAAGDFLLLTAATWRRLRGFNETVRFAKIHKDGQFCFRTWLEGLPVDVLGPIWHIDHEGSYANAGAAFGSPAQPYGPEWSYRQDYRNPSSWGLAAAIDEPSDGALTWLRHPATRGPLVTVIGTAAVRERVGRLPAECEWRDVDDDTGVAAINEALATAHGRFLFVAGSWPLTASDLDSLLAFVRDEAPELWTVGGAPSFGAPFGISRGVYDAAGELRELSRDAVADLWRRAAPGRTVQHWRPVGEPGRVPRVAERPGASPVAPHAADARELAACLADAAGWVATWLRSLELDPGTAAAVLGPDWATPFLIRGLQLAGHRMCGLLTADPRETGTDQWGWRVGALEEASTLGVRFVVGWAADERTVERLRAGGFTGRAATWLGGVPAALPPVPAGELTLRRARQAESLAAGRLDDVLANLPILAALEGVQQFAHRYDAAMLADRQGHTAEAHALFADVASDANGDPALRMRATFHLGRLQADAGDVAAALACFDRVLAHTPGHVRAFELATDLVARGPDRDALLAGVTPVLGARLAAALASGGAS